MTHSDVIIGHVVTSSVKLYQEAPSITGKIFSLFNVWKMDGLH